MIERASLVQSPLRPSARASRTPRGMTRRRLIRCPITASSAGRSVADAAMATIGRTTQPTPIDCMKGTGIRISSARPTPTVMPEKSVARPAVTIVRSSASCGSSLRASSSRNRNTTSIE